ncbi:hypothetical protein GBK02_15970 [Dechloromonas sp. TW-R-39-2]|uniref:hypothetical protein n=1 Tax=Dechloromonas sp. TW-R-39-2 TaxID=2654218 RepID=UPI00193E7965|nr:hypothetical protein [Dechloromonas sp. TW-R-39-2]QRM20763.1 hypothetical protein GBK02_15970 [Dechloromonas sp. TW-R-39-2]
MTVADEHIKALNRLRAAGGLVPIIESGLSKAQMPTDRVEKMICFCEWSLQADTDGDSEATKLRSEIHQGLARIKALMLQSHPMDQVEI